MLVPKANAELLRLLARGIRARHRLEWLAASGARRAIRDSRAPGAERYLWTLTVFGYHQLAARSGRPSRRPQFEQGLFERSVLFWRLSLGCAMGIAVDRNSTIV